MVYFPPFDELEALIKYVKSGEKTPPTSLRHVCLAIICYAKAQVPYGQALIASPIDFNNQQLLELLTTARSNTQWGWVNLIIPTLRILKLSFLTSDAPPLPRKSIPSEECASAELPPCT